MNAFLAETLTGQKAKDQPVAFDHYSVTDAKSLYDAIRQMTPRLSEKRTIIDLTAVRDVIPKDKLIRVPTSAMDADGHTKTDWTLMEFMTKFMLKTFVGQESSIPRSSWDHF